MYIRQRPALGERANRASKIKYCNERSKPTTTRLNWSRRPSLQKADAELLAAVGLALETVPGTAFNRFVSARSQELEEAS